MNIDVRDILVRALKTFLQAFLATLAVGITAVDGMDALTALLVAGLAAGISALQNFVRDTL